MTSRYDFHITTDTLGDGNNTVSIQLGMVGRNKSVLELGCATGRVTRLLKAQGCKVTCVEAVAEWADQALPFCEKLIVGNLEDEHTLSALTGEKFEVILAGDVLEHLREPGALMKALRHNLHPEGYWVISVPNIAHWSVRKELLQGRFNFTETGVMDRTHLRWFTVDTLRRMVEEAGYKVQEMEAVYTLPMQDALRIRGVASRLRRTKKLPNLFGIQLIGRVTIAN
jgi:2-polyprenyl-3-methyl-5-hydroxy-6-metoxy-1,4-benzoquinol methylase